MKSKTLLWLDDYRDPFDSNVNWLTFSPISLIDVEVVWVKSYKEFTEWIITNGLPDAICFDHDLAHEHMSFFFTNGGHENPPDPSSVEFEEKTGYDCAKWLVNYCMDNKCLLPAFSSQ
jgi:hypothetical protein